MNNHKKIAIMQVFILVVAIFAFAWMIGNEFREVSAKGDKTGDAACIDVQGKCTEPLTKYDGDSCTINGKAGYVREGLCSGDYNNLRCCITCLDTCSSLKYECGVQTICSIPQDCGTCSSGTCSKGKCIEKDKKEESKPTPSIAVVSTDGTDTKKSSFSIEVEGDDGETKTFEQLPEGAVKKTDKGDYEVDNNILSKLFTGTVTTTGGVLTLREGAKVVGKGKVTEALISSELYTGDAGLPMYVGTEGTLGPPSSTIIPKTGATLGEILGGGSTAVGQLAATLAWSAIAFTIGRCIIGPLLGLTVQQSQSLGYALAAGTFVGIGGTKIGLFGAAGQAVLGIGVLGALGIGIGVAAIVFIATAKHSSVDVIAFNCYMWDAQPKGENCELCNKNEDLPCTEYQCKSLGQGCELIYDEGGKSLCIWLNPNDIDPPIIEPWEEALLEDYKYYPDNQISPPDRGVYIQYTKSNDKCAPAFTPLTFGVELNEPAKCKISTLRLPSYDEMPDIFMGSGTRDYNHSFALSLPNSKTLEVENITLDNEGNYELYVKCINSNGNANSADFVFKFCIAEGPDTTAPLIVSTSILDGFPIAVGQTSIGLDLYVNEPSECKWSHTDQDYDSMEETMVCSTKIYEMNAQLLYRCSTTLTGLKDRTDNKFYFRCKDQPGADESDRNANTQSYPLTLIGTEPLVIDWVKPEGVIEDSTEVIKVNLEAHTSAGYDEGKAICAFSETGKSGSYIDFFYGYETELYSQYQHSQELWLAEGDYEYFIQCRDLGGNMDNANVSFTIETDTESPVVVRAFKEDDYLKIITSESAECVYSNFGCTYLYDDGTPMTALGNTEHYTDWDINTDFYIKCQDEYGNRPLPNQCSLIARPFEIFKPLE